jgi:hypothetical protein
MPQGGEFREHLNSPRELRRNQPRHVISQGLHVHADLQLNELCAGIGIGVWFYMDGVIGAVLLDRITAFP